MDKLHTIYLHGSLGDSFSSKPIQLYAKDVEDCVRGLRCMFGLRFTKEILSGSWHILAGTEVISEQLLKFPTKSKDIHIYPKLAGAEVITAIVGAIVSAVGSGVGAVSTFLGLGLTEATIASVAEFIVMSAASSALSAIVNAISAPTMNYNNAEVQRKASFMYNGVVNIVEQGGVVPLVYGTHLTGSTVVSVNMVSRQIGANSNIVEGLTNPLLAVSDSWSTVGCTFVKGTGDSFIITKTAPAGQPCYAELLIPQVNPTGRYSIVVSTTANLIGVHIPIIDFGLSGIYDYDRPRVTGSITQPSYSYANPYMQGQYRVDEYISKIYQFHANVAQQTSTFVAVSGVFQGELNQSIRIEIDDMLPTGTSYTITSIQVTEL